MTQRQEIIERLNGLELEGGSHEMLSAICKAVLPHSGAWTLRMCCDLRDRLVRLLGEAEQPKEQGEGGEYSMDELLRMLRTATSIDSCHGKMPEGWCGKYHHCVDCRAALIDAISAASCDELQRAYGDGYDAGVAVADDWCAQHEDAMNEHGWYRALDADKQPIKLGDEVYQVEGGLVYTVESITFYPDNTTVTFGCKHGFGCDNAHSVHHHHAPTVEDVLKEFAFDVLPATCIADHEVTDAIERFAPMLRLAGDAE